MKKRIVLGLAGLMSLMGFATLLQATPVDHNTTRRVAVNFWNTYRLPQCKLADTVLMSRMENTGFANLDIYTLDGYGFVAVATDNSVPPVLAYSFDSPAPARIHASAHEWFAAYDMQIALAREAHQQPTAQTAADWEQLLTATPPDQPLSLTDIAAMVTTHWDQGEPYNKFCPFDSNYNERTVVGCTATAMAQLMRYWSYPSFGDSNHYYTHQLEEYDPYYSVSYGTLGSDFSQTTFIWEYMSNAVYPTSPLRNIDAVATLSYFCGVSVNMAYGPSATGGSGAWTISYGDADRPCAEHAFRKYFKYDASVHGERRRHHSDEEWHQLIEADLEAGRPILYTGSDNGGGHAFVLDGSDLAQRYHFNWGWGGSFDGFFRIDSLYLGGGGIGSTHSYSFNQDQTAIFSLFPREEEHFDTVDRTDTVCNDVSTFYFYEYELPVEEASYVLRHLDTVFRLDIKVMRKRFAYLDPNGANGSRRTVYYCPVTGLLMPENTFRRDGYVFMGWCADARGNGDTIYQPGHTAPIRHNALFYAVWRDSAELASVATADAMPEPSIWPNPTLDRISIDGIDGEYEVTIFEPTGRAIMVKKGMRNEAKIDLSGMPAGIYLLRVKGQNGVYNQRVIKQ